MVETLVRERLIACGNISAPVRSLYFWEGELCRDVEALLWMETTDELVSALTERIRQIHPYTVPKVLTLEVAGANADYDAWVATVTGGQRGR
jgi:periplasmic divalent cation tolerance protein